MSRDGRGHPGDIDDDALMERFVAGDAGAFETLYDRHERPVFSLCLRFLGDEHAAEDALQEVFVRVVDDRRRYQPLGKFRQWLFTIARRICIDRARKSERSGRNVPVEAAALSGRASSPAAEAEAGDLLDKLLARLTGAQREVLLLHRHHGFSYAEIAELTESTTAAVKQMAYRALGTLRETLDGFEGEQEGDEP